METKKYLELSFTTSTGSEHRLNVESPQDPINPADVKTAMNSIVAANIFEGKGDLIGIKGARLISRTVEEVSLP